MRVFQVPVTLMTMGWLILGAGCEEKTPETQAPAAAPTPTPTPTPEPTPEPEEPPTATRPATIETEVTAERRAKVEEALTETKGFLVAAEIEEKLKANKAVDKTATAVKTFDRTASGKWVLFTGPITNMTDTGFDLGITYTPQLPNDPMGMSRQWFPVTFEDIKGYEPDKFKGGQMVVVAAKYAGDQKAGPGYELVDVGHW